MSPRLLISVLPQLHNFTERAMCAGAIFFMKYILTAAQCVNDYNLEAIKVSEGYTNRISKESEVADCDRTTEWKRWYDVKQVLQGPRP